MSSSNDEQLLSYNIQIKYFRKYITDNPQYDFVGIYADEGISGTDIRKREEFNRLMDDARNNKIDMIITKSLSRFGRNTLDCLNSIRELKGLGVDVFFEKENIHIKDSDGELLITLLLATAQNESAALSENIKWGIHRKYETGNIKSIPSGKFFGYNKDIEGNLIIDEEQALIVKRVYKEFLDGYGYYQIAEHLTNEGIITETGNNIWSCTTLKKILTNEKYKGDTLFQKTYNTNFLTKKRAKNNGKLPKYYCENTHPNIIEKDIWECVQLEFERQAKVAKEREMYKYHQHSERFPFLGKMVCKECGHCLVRRQSKRSMDEGAYYWCCKKYRQGRYKAITSKDCTNGIRLKDSLPEEIFIESWNRLIENKEWRYMLRPKNELEQYRVKELITLVEEVGKIKNVEYELVLSTLDYIEINEEGVAKVIFLAGIGVQFLII